MDQCVKIWNVVSSLVLLDISMRCYLVLQPFFAIEAFKLEHSIRFWWIFTGKSWWRETLTLEVYWELLVCPEASSICRALQKVTRSSPSMQQRINAKIYKIDQHIIINLFSSFKKCCQIRGRWTLLDLQMNWYLPIWLLVFGSYVFMITICSHSSHILNRFHLF